MLDKEKIKSEGIKILEEFSETLKKVPETEETHYVVDMKNVQRNDDKPLIKKGFSDKLFKLAPKTQDGYVVAEKGQ